MKLAISNIAWQPDEDHDILTLMKEFNVMGLEVAPTKVYPEPEKADNLHIDKFKSYWKENQIELVAMQSLLFNKPNLSIFGHPAEETKEYLYSIIEMAGKLGTKALVFGSPKNRLLKELNSIQARHQAIDFFCELGNKALLHDVFICIEANPIEYGCDFITSTLEGLQFVKDTNHKAIKLQLDTSTMIINKENPREIIDKCFSEMGHFHISEPYLQMIGQSDHLVIANALKDSGYTGWVSIEMKNNLSHEDTKTIKKALEYVSSVYF